MPIDWSWQDVHARKEAERDADAANRRSGKLAEDLDTARGNAQARAFTIAALEQKIVFLEERLAEVEGQLRHYKSVEEGFVANVRALVQEAECCSHASDHALHITDANGRSKLDEIYEAAYMRKWSELGQR